MSSSATITREQLRAVLVATELGGKSGESDHFSYAELGSSTYSFGQLQFDVGNSPAARAFLSENGFNHDDLKNLSSGGGLSRKELDALDVKLQAIPRVKMEQFTNQQLDGTIGRVSGIIDNVRTQNSSAADAIVSDAKLQLGIADYANQFSGRHDCQLAGFLAGKSELGMKSANPPTREDIQTFIGSTAYGSNKANARAVDGRAERFNAAMIELGLAPAAHAHNHMSSEAGSVLRPGTHDDAVGVLQANLAALGYTDKRGQLLQPDGYYGRQTEAAVKAFQGDHGLPVDGVAGMHTLEAIQSERHLLDGTPALAPELQGNPHSRIDRTDPANRAPAGHGPHTRDLPDVIAPAVHPYADPRHPDHALYAELRERIPQAGERRLAQITAACHMSGIRSGEIGQIWFRGDDSLLSAPKGGPGRGTEVALTSPAPPVQQTMQQLQAFDRQQQETRAQMTAQQAHAGPVTGSPGGGLRMG